MYVCGITPYDATHIGHAATYITFDLVHRAWLDAGHDVHYVQNVTDVDDPLLERAQRDGQDWAELAEREVAVFREDMTALGVIPPRDYVGVVESVDLIAGAVARLVESGAAYDVDGDTYFAVHSDPRFGSVGSLDDDTMLALFAERGGDPRRPGKKHPLDCLLWQAARPGEPSWETDALPAGRPGVAPRVRGDRAGPARPHRRRAGRRHRPGLPASRDDRVGGARPHRRVAVRAALRARRHGRARR